MLLVSGAAGFVGQHLANRLLRLNIPFAVIYHKRPPLKKWRELGVDSFCVDITRPIKLESVQGEFDTLINLSAFIPWNRNDKESLMDLHNVNTIGIKNILDLCLEKGIKKIIHSSSVSVYNVSRGSEINESTREEPLSYYGKSKYLGDLICRDYTKKTDLNIAILRYSSIYGPGQHNNSVLPIFIKRAKANKEIVIHGKGERSQDFIYVKDVASANILAINKAANGTFLIGSGKSINMLNLATSIKSFFKSSSAIKFDEDIKEDGSRTSVNINKSRNILGFSPEYDLKAGIADYNNNLC